MPRITMSLLPWGEDRRAASMDESQAVLLLHILVGGRRIDYKTASIRWEGPSDFLCLYLTDVPQEQFDLLTPDQYGMGSTAAELIILISAIDIVEETVPVYAVS